MSVNQNHLLIGFLAVLVGLILMVTVGNATFDRSEVVKALSGLLLIFGGAIAGAQVPRS